MAKRRMKYYPEPVMHNLIFDMRKYSKMEGYLNSYLMFMLFLLFVSLDLGHFRSMKISYHLLTLYQIQPNSKE